MKHTAIALLTACGLLASNATAFAESYLCDDYDNPRPERRDREVRDSLFTFNNLYGYNNCLDHIVLNYEGRDRYLRTLEREGKIQESCIEEVFDTFGTDLDRDLVLELIEVADERAELISEEKKLYPGYGIRRRIALQLGYLYEIDREDEQVCSLARDWSDRNRDWSDRD